MRPGILLVIDGWGVAAPGHGNAVAAAETPALDRLRTECPWLELQASGRAVGLPDGVVGNSEIGHMVIGAGRPLDYDSLLVQRSVDSGQLRTHPVLLRTCGELARTGGTLHLVGLCSDGMIHSDLAHMVELLNAVGNTALTDVAVHAITDGRDVADHTAAEYLARLDAAIGSAGVGRVATVIGRNYAMDKSGDTELTRQACRLLLDGDGHPHSAPASAAAAHLAHRGDGWIPPAAITSPGIGTSTVADGDAVLFVNFRSDRIAPLVDTAADQLAEQGRDVRLLSLAQYDTRAVVEPLVPRTDASGGLADVLEEHGLRSVRIAEHEKFEHVTFYVNGRDPRRRPGEEHLEIGSGQASDHAGRPQMNVADVARSVVEAAERPDTALVIANLANIDVVGHTGDYGATVKAAEAVDAAVQHICTRARENGRWVLLVGDHGNGESMLQATDDGGTRPYGGHTLNPVPCVLVPAANETLAAPATADAALSNVAPTVCDLLGLPPSAQMSSPSLLFAPSAAGSARTATTTP